MEARFSWNLFDLLGTPPILGRGFAPEDDRPGAEPVVMLSYQVWEHRYHSDSSVIGRAVSINSRPHTVIGVMPPRFGFPEIARLWVTLAHYGEKTTRDDRPLEVFGRLKPGVSRDRRLSAFSGD